jgi:hypothetical protein
MWREGVPVFSRARALARCARIPETSFEMWNLASMYAAAAVAPARPAARGAGGCVVSIAVSHVVSGQLTEVHVPRQFR